VLHANAPHQSEHLRPLCRGACVADLCRQCVVTRGVVMVRSVCCGGTDGIGVKSTMLVGAIGTVNGDSSGSMCMRACVHVNLQACVRACVRTCVCMSVYNCVFA